MVTAPPPASRQRIEPPSMWGLFIAGSLCIHAALLLALRPYLMRLTQAQVKPAPIQVEWVASPNTPRVQASPTPARKVAPPPQILSPTPLTERNQPQTQPLVLSQPRSTALVPALRQPRSPTPPVPSPESRRPVPQSPSPQPRSSAPPSPIAAPTQPITSGQSIATRPPDSTPESGTATSNLPSSGRNEAPALPSVQVASQPTRGRGLKLTIIEVKNVGTGKLITGTGEGDAFPRSSFKDFPDRAIPPVIELNLGSEVRFVTQIDRDGRARVTEEKQGARAQEYTDLARDLLQEIPFNPALQAGQPLDSVVEIALRIDAL